MYAAYATAYQGRSVDYDLHGLVGIRLIDPSASDCAAITRQLGSIQSTLERIPDIVIRFVDRLPSTGRLRYLGVDEAGFTDDAFVILRSKYKSQAKVQLPFAAIGSEQCEIVCEHGLSAVPLLIPLVNLTALSRGVMPLHAAGFVYNGVGTVVTGWSKGGKTETLLAFMDRGAHYIGDEWIYISSDGQHIYGIPEPIRLWEWHLHDLPVYQQRIQRRDLIRLRAIKTVLTLEQGLPDGRASLGLVRRVMRILKRQLHVDVHPAQLFGERSRSTSAAFDQLFFVGSHAAPETCVQPIEGQEVAERMVFSLEYERQNFMAYYLAFRFAFPHLRNALIEQAGRLYREGLLRLFAGREAHAVFHPYPVALPTLFETIQPLLVKREPAKSYDAQY